MISSSKFRVLSRPEEGLRALAQHVPQAEAFAERAAQQVRPATTWLYASRRRLATVSIGVVTLWLFVHIMFGANGMVIYRQKRAEFEEMQHDVNGLQKENQRYTGHIQGLKTDPQTIEREAREQLHYAKPGEVIYVAPQPITPPNPTTNSARK